MDWTLAKTMETGAEKYVLPRMFAAWMRGIFRHLHRAVCTSRRVIRLFQPAKALNVNIERQCRMLYHTIWSQKEWMK